MNIIFMLFISLLLFANCSIKPGNFDWGLDQDVARRQESDQMKKPPSNEKTNQDALKNKNVKKNHGNKNPNYNQRAKQKPNPKKNKSAGISKTTKSINNKNKNLKRKIPLWILNGGKYNSDADDNYLYAVGFSGGEQNDTLLKFRSEDKARENMIRKISEFKVIMDHTIESNVSNLKNLTKEDKRQLKSVVLKITSTLLANVELQETWKNPIQPEQYTLARLKLSPFKMAYKGDLNLKLPVKTYLKYIFEKTWKEYNQKARDGSIIIENQKHYVVKGNRYYFY